MAAQEALVEQVLLQVHQLQELVVVVEELIYHRVDQVEQVVEETVEVPE
jgi:hypothetical protein